MSRKVTAAAWSPLRLAVCSERVVVLFDENGDKRDKFSTKAADPKVKEGDKRRRPEGRGRAEGSTPSRG